MSWPLGDCILIGSVASSTKKLIKEICFANEIEIIRDISDFEFHS
jgi:hypothetical protein